MSDQVKSLPGSNLLFNVQGLNGNTFSLIHIITPDTTLDSISLHVLYGNEPDIRILSSNDNIISYCENVMAEEYVEDSIDNEQPSDRLAFYLSLFEVIKNAYLYHKKALSL